MTKRILVKRCGSSSGSSSIYHKKCGEGEEKRTDVRFQVGSQEIRLRYPRLARSTKGRNSVRDDSSSVNVRERESGGRNDTA